MTAKKVAVIEQHRGKPRERGVTSLARSHTKEAVERAVELMRQDKFPAVAMRAVEWLVDRGWGKAVQPIADGTDHPALELDLNGVPFTELQRMEQTLTKLLARSQVVHDAEFTEVPKDSGINTNEDQYSKAILDAYNPTKAKPN